MNAYVGTYKRRTVLYDAGQARVQHTAVWSVRAAVRIKDFSPGVDILKDFSFVPNGFKSCGN